MLKLNTPIEMGNKKQENFTNTLWKLKILYKLLRPYNNQFIKKFIKNGFQKQEGFNNKYFKVIRAKQHI